MVGALFGILISTLIWFRKYTSHPKCTTLEQFLDVPSVSSRCPEWVQKGWVFF